MAGALRSSTVTLLALRGSGKYYRLLATGSAVQYLTVIVLAALAFFVFSFFLCFLCLDALIVLRLGGALSNTAYYRLVSPPASLRLLSHLL